MATKLAWGSRMGISLHFLTKNDYKFKEFKRFFAATSHVVSKAPISIEEIQSENMEALVEDKVLKAFDKIRRPVFVDHTGLHLESLNGFPGGLTELFWERLKNQRLAELFGNSSVKAVTLIGYCDGKSLLTFRGELEGTIAAAPRGPEGFQWDPIFVPNGHFETFAEMGDAKHNISMRRKAIDRFIAHLDKMS